MKLWKRNAVVAAIVLFVCVAVYLNWSYQQEAADTGKTLGQATLVDGRTKDPLLSAASAAPGESGKPTETAGASTGYFASARLNRQQARDSALTMLQDTVNSDAADAAAKTEAGTAIETLATATVSEAQIENLVIAKGYADCVAFISDGGVSVVVSATENGLQDADVARITEIVTGETGVPASQIKIIEAEG
ncbi:MAG: SpoIIIAH-like family protein [Pseudoflavonifractor sp.]|nr:SpoIIIAH-like family protein [Pseudoflavonifractor sp.]MDY3018879.1 SpoIIIAH-like family protein [Oscillospiraceae bacterium]